MDMPTSKNLIYAYVETRPGHPRFNEIRYIGKSGRGMDRANSLSGHKHGRVKNGIKAHESVCVLPTVIVLEEIPLCGSEELSQHERQWIKVFRGLGTDLWNLTDGGDGIPGYKDSEETKALKSKIAKRRGVSEACRIACKKANTGNTRCRGRKVSDETKRKISQAQLGKKRGSYSLNHCIAISKSKLEKNFTDQFGNIYSRGIRNAAKELGLDSSSMSKVLKGKRLKSTGGFCFKFVDNEDT